MKFRLLIAINIILLPVYLAGFLLMLTLSFTPIFPARVARQNLRERLNVGPWRARWLAALCLYHYYIYFIEIGVIWPLGLTQVSNTIEAEMFVNAMASKYRNNESGLGFAFLASHFGSIETIGQSFGEVLKKRLGKGVVALAQPSRFPGLTALASWYRSRRSIVTILTHSRNLATTLAEVGTSGSSIGLLVDQKPRKGGVFINFFGAPAAFPHRGPGIMVSNKVPVLFAAAIRIFPGYFKQIFSDSSNPHLNFNTKNSRFPSNTIVHTPHEVQPETAQLLAEFAAWLESEIKKDVWQWCWDYRKWSRKPPEISLPAK